MCGNPQTTHILTVVNNFWIKDVFCAKNIFTKMLPLQRFRFQQGLIGNVVKINDYTRSCEF